MERAYLQVKRIMRIMPLRPKVKALLPRTAETLISIEIDSLDRPFLFAIQ
jgi:hypothetical protein